MKFLLTIAFLSLCISCSSTSETNTRYDQNEIGTTSNVSCGRIVAIEQVNVEGTSSGAGTFLGAGMGGVLGSMVGKGGRANTAGAIAGGVVGGIVGYKTEKKITSGTSYRYVIEKENKDMIVIIQSNEKGFKVGDRIMIMSGKNTKIDFDLRK